MSDTRSIRTLGPKVAKFYETYLVHPKGDAFGTPFVLEPWQRDFLNEAYRVREDGRRVYRQIILGIPRGNGKTPLAAGLGLFELMARKDQPEIYNIAGAKEQASVLTDFATAFVRRGENGRPGKLLRWLDASKKSVVHKETYGVMRLLSSSGSLHHGKSVSGFIADELHAFETEDQQEAYVAMWTGMKADRRNPFATVISTAGFNKATLLGRMYDEALERLEFEERNFVDGVGPCLRIGRDEQNGVLFWWYGPPDELSVEEALENEALWRAVNPASWVTLEWLRLQLGGIGLDELDFARLHLNMWTQSRDVFIPTLAWRACKSEQEPKRGRPVSVAVDIGLTHDTTAVGWSQALGEGRKVINRARIWSANPDHERDETQRHKYVRGRVDLEEIFEFILELHRSFGIRELVFDPTFFEGEAQRLARKGIKVAPIYQAGVLPDIAYQRFYQDVKEGRALHGGDPVLTRHVLAAAGVKTERGWRVSELRSSDVIDGLQAVSMSHWRESRESSSVYEERGMLLLGGSDDDVEVDDDDD